MELVKRLSRLPRRWVLLVCACFVLLPPAGAYAYFVDTYWQDVNQAGGVWGTAGYAPREWNRVWHQVGRYWNPFYCPPANPCFGGSTTSSNPSYASGSASYAAAYCQNIDDNSGVTWTCQTTVPN